MNFGDYAWLRPHFKSLWMDAAALLVYDIMDNDSFIRVRKWVKELQQMASKDIIMAIAANKSDLVRAKKLDVQEAERSGTFSSSQFIINNILWHMDNWYPLLIFLVPHVAIKLSMSQLDVYNKNKW